MGVDQVDGALEVTIRESLRSGDGKVMLLRARVGGAMSEVSTLLLMQQFAVERCLVDPQPNREAAMWLRDQAPARVAFMASSAHTSDSLADVAFEQFVAPDRLALVEGASEVAHIIGIETDPETGGYLLRAYFPTAAEVPDNLNDLVAVFTFLGASRMERQDGSILLEKTGRLDSVLLVVAPTYVPQTTVAAPGEPLPPLPDSAYPPGARPLETPLA